MGDSSSTLMKCCKTSIEIIKVILKVGKIVEIGVKCHEN